MDWRQEEGEEEGGKRGVKGLERGEAITQSLQVVLQVLLGETNWYSRRGWEAWSRLAKVGSQDFRRM